LRRDTRVEAGERWQNTAATLCQWARDDEDTAVKWDALTQAQKDARVKVRFERMGKLPERMADLLEATGRGN